MFMCDPTKMPPNMRNFVNSELSVTFSLGSMGKTIIHVRINDHDMRFRSNLYGLV